MLLFFTLFFGLDKMIRRANCVIIFFHEAFGFRLFLFVLALLTFSLLTLIEGGRLLFLLSFSYMRGSFSIPIFKIFVNTK